MSTSIDTDRVAEITAACAQVAAALKELAPDSAGTDLVSTLMSMLGRAEPGAPRAAIVPSDFELITRSHDLIDALDRGDVDAVEAALAPDFLHFEGGPTRDRDAVLTTIKQRTSTVPFIATRTWESDSVTRKGDALVFTGMAHEVQGGNETRGGHLYDGWYLLRWVHSGDAWRVQLLTWQHATTEREAWNDTFKAGRGFSREPNRLLVETIEHETPGTALELAMGQGRNALYLASEGWQVTGVDSSSEGLRIACEQAVERELVLETIHADLDEWHFGERRFDLVTLMYAGDHPKWIDKIKASLREDGLIVIEGWAKQCPDSPCGFGDGELAKLFQGYEIVRDEIVEDVPDWAWDKGKLARFVARKK